MDLSHHIVTARMQPRRAFLGGAMAAATAAFASPSLAHNSAGVVKPPLAPPPVELTLETDRKSTLEQELRGHVTALQLIFTSCQATCPIQGAIFGQGVKDLGNQLSDALWLSVSIDPEHDDPKALREWLAKFGGSPRWHAARPAPEQLGTLMDFLKARDKGADRHTAQVFFFNRNAELAMRTVDFPPAHEIVRILKELASLRT